jgi:myo-inositol-1(or 4)-monophosphatase
MYRERMEFIKQLALEAGTLTLEGFGKCDQMPKDVSDGYDIATVYDLRTEELIKTRILDEFSEPILGEEEGLVGDREMAQRKLWIVDPIDGTFNYQRGLPLYGVSIAFCEDGLPVCGAIFLPALEQLFFAAKGSGASLVQDDASAPLPVVVSQERELPRLVISLAGSGAYRLAAACSAEGVPWRSLRFLMCAVVSIAYVASGHIDAFSDTSLSVWDCAAGDILLREAGGPALVDYRHTPIFPTYVHRRVALDDTRKFTCVAASNQALFYEPLGRVISTAGLRPEDVRAAAGSPTR